MPKLRVSESNKRNQLKKDKPLVYKKIKQFDKKLKKNESIAIIQFQYDYSCNFRCEHCSVKGFQGKKEGKYFTPKEVKNLADQAHELGLAHFVITGGEPLIFQDFDEIVKAIGPKRFYITSDTNGWLLDEKKARHLKEIGVDKVQLSLDSMSVQEHDEFRHKDGAHARALRAIDAAQKAGLDIIVQTVVTKQRLHSKEFITFLRFLNRKNVGVFVTFAKPVGAWEGKFDCLIDKSDRKFMKSLEKKHNVFTHLTPSYGHNLGCIAVKRMISVTKYGDVMPCPYIHVSLGNIFKEPLKDIIKRGMNNKFFGKYADTCWIAEDRKFIDKYIVKKVYGKPLPVPYGEVFSDDDKIK